jgi:hypothetical protein
MPPEYVNAIKLLSFFGHRLCSLIAEEYSTHSE